MVAWTAPLWRVRAAWPAVPMAFAFSGWSRRVMSWCWRSVQSVHWMAPPEWRRSLTRGPKFSMWGPNRTGLPAMAASEGFWPP